MSTQKPNAAEGWAAEWATSAALRAEFPTAESYAALMKRDALRAEMGSSPKSTPSSAAISKKPVPQTDEGWTAEWEATPGLQAEFPTAGAYVALKKRDAR